MSVDFYSSRSGQLLPIIGARGRIEVVPDPSVIRADLSLLTFSSVDNRWVFDVTFEVLLLLKALLFLLSP
jgi:hypothetical protein